MLQVFCDAVDDRAGIPAPVLGYIRSAFLRYLSGEVGLEKALHLARPKNRAVGTHGKSTDPLQMAALFFLYTERDGLTATAAKEKIETMCHTSQRNVERAVQKNRDIQRLAGPATRGGKPVKRSFVELEILAEDTAD